jgi:hypothetical protein
MCGNRTEAITGQRRLPRQQNSVLVVVSPKRTARIGCKESRTQFIEALCQPGSRKVCSREGFVRAPHVLALVPTTPNPTTYGLHYTKRVPFRYRFDEKPPVNSGCDVVSRFSLTRIFRTTFWLGFTGPVAGRLEDSLPPEIPPVLAAVAKEGRCLPDAH